MKTAATVPLYHDTYRYIANDVGSVRPSLVATHPMCETIDECENYECCFFKNLVFFVF